MTDPAVQPWCTRGAEVTVWTVEGRYLGMMNSAALAARVVAAHNAILEQEGTVVDDDRPVRQPQDVANETANHDALRALTKDQLRGMVDDLGLDVPASATKADLLVALGVPAE